MMVMEVYRQPLYYEIAFSFIDSKGQIDNFEKLIARFSKRKVERFLDVACGPSFQLREIARRGYGAVGLDASPEMLEYLEKKAVEEGLKIETVRGDLESFRLEEPADFAFIMMGSLNVESNDMFLSHLDSVASSLNSGGLYFIQNMSLDWTKPAKQTWTMKRDGIRVKTVYRSRFLDVLNQICEEELTLEVNDHGRRERFSNLRRLKFIFPQEFRALVRMNGKFDFLGWWKGNCNVWHLDQPLEQAGKLQDNMTLLRRR